MADLRTLIPTAHAPSKSVFLPAAAHLAEGQTRYAAAELAHTFRGASSHSAALQCAIPRPLLPGGPVNCWPPWTLPSTPRSALKQQKLHDHVPGEACASSALPAGEPAGIGTPGLLPSAARRLRSLSSCPLPQHGFPPSLTPLGCSTRYYLLYCYCPLAAPLQLQTAISRRAQSLLCAQGAVYAAP